VWLELGGTLKCFLAILDCVFRVTGGRGDYLGNPKSFSSQIFNFFLCSSNFGWIDKFPTSRFLLTLVLVVEQWHTNPTLQKL